jgi:gamma-glutamyl phosphate reductase
MQDILEICRKAKSNTVELANLSAEQKNAMLQCVADALRESCGEILKANDMDMAASADRPKQFLDRLQLNEARIEAMAQGIEQVIALADPVGEVLEEFDRPNGLHIVKRRVPLGLLGIIYEARPNVTSDCIALALKSGNCVVLRGSRDALNSNLTIVSAIKRRLKEKGFNSEYIQIVEDTSREGANKLMKLNGVIDVLLPRGGAGLIRSVVENSSIPVIETGTGNCHVYVEKSADPDMAAEILINAKTQRPSVCNAAESLLIDEAILPTVFPKLCKALTEKGVTVRGCEKCRAVLKELDAATEEDFAAEYQGYVISAKAVSGVKEAAAHINRYGTHHSETIVTEDGAAAERFMGLVDSACVYHNASTRFTDGGEFGFGCEIGISTQKLHARGPMGLKELTSYKYCIYGTGQIR